MLIIKNIDFRWKEVEGCYIHLHYERGSALEISNSPSPLPPPPGREFFPYIEVGENSAHQDYSSRINES